MGDKQGEADALADPNASSGEPPERFGVVPRAVKDVDQIDIRTEVELPRAQFASVSLAWTQPHVHPEFRATKAQSALADLEHAGYRLRADDCCWCFDPHRARGGAPQRPISYCSGVVFERGSSRSRVKRRLSSCDDVVVPCRDWPP